MRKSSVSYHTDSIQEKNERIYVTVVATDSKQPDLNGGELSVPKSRRSRSLLRSLLLSLSRLSRLLSRFSRSLSRSLPFNLSSEKSSLFFISTSMVVTLTQDPALSSKAARGKTADNGESHGADGWASKESKLEQKKSN